MKDKFKVPEEKQEGLKLLQNQKIKKLIAVALNLIKMSLKN